MAHAPLTGTGKDFFEFHHISILNFIAAAGLVYNLAPGHLAFTPIVNVVWTLPLEVDMYLLLPGIFAFVYRVLAVWPILTLWLLACLVVMSAGAGGGLTFLSAIPCFLPGVIAYVGYRRTRPSLSPWLLPGCLFAATFCLLLRPSVPACWIFCLALGSALPLFRPFQRSFFTRASHAVAKYSYGIYLAHPFGLLLGCYLLRTHAITLQLLVAALTTGIAAVVSYHLLEAPMIRVGARTAANLETRALGGRTLLSDHSLT
jgi:peptidoglycan/LPS O-acetylase OafA/YrhL